MATFTVPDAPEMRYLQALNAVMEALTRAAAMFALISQDGANAAIRNDARVKSMEALLDLELVKDQHDAVMSGHAAVNPPSSAQVQRTISIATELAQMTASEKKFAAILKLFTEAVDTMNAIHAASAFAPPKEVGQADEYFQEVTLAPADEPVATHVAIWFGTNRVHQPAQKGVAQFGRSRAGWEQPLSYGKAWVSVPATHSEAEIERPKWWKLEFTPDPKKHMLVSSIELQDVDRWAADAAKPGSEGLLFIHGFNVDFENALLRTGQLAFDLKFTGVPLCFSWASSGKVASYLSDEETAEWSVPHLVEFLQTVRTRLGLKSLHVIAHSMGNRVLLRALDKINSTPPEPVANSAPISQIVLAAADIGVDVFRQLKRCLSMGEQVTAYASRADRALLLSRQLHDSPRIGDADPPFTAQEMSTIDATLAGAEMFGLGHSYAASNRGVFGDLFYVIRHRLKPDDRKSIKKLPAGYYELA